MIVPEIRYEIGNDIISIAESPSLLVALESTAEGIFHGKARCYLHPKWGYEFHILR